MNLVFPKALIALTFIHGLFVYTGIGNFYYKICVSATTCIFVLLTLIYEKNPIKFDKFFIIVSLYFAWVTVSGIINSSDIIKVYSYALYTIPGIAIYLYIIKCKFSEKKSKRIVNFIIGLYIFQIFCSFIKLIYLMGTQSYYRSEAIVGTIHYTNGSLNTIIPLIGISGALAYYYFGRKQTMSILCILGFLFMGWVGEKRGVFIYFIILSGISYLLYMRVQRSTLTINIVATVLLLFVFIFGAGIIGIKYTPTLNPENKMGGSFDIEHVYTYSRDYSFGYDDKGYAMGRFSSVISIGYNLVNLKNNTAVLAGLGPDELIGTTEQDYDLEKHGISEYMGLIGISTAVISIGLIGAGLVIILYGYVGLYVYKITCHENSIYWKTLGLATLLITVVFFLDFLTYSRSFYHTQATNVTLLCLYGLIKKRASHKVNSYF